VGKKKSAPQKVPVLGKEGGKNRGRIGDNGRKEEKRHLTGEEKNRASLNPGKGGSARKNVAVMKKGEKKKALWG